MANIAIKDQNARTVIVDRQDLFVTLVQNKSQHIRKYEEALKNYKQELLKKVKKSFEKAEKDLSIRKQELINRVANLTDEEVKEQDDYVVIINQVGVDMESPKCFSNEYEAAIDMVQWDTRDELELTAAEFNCFVRDKWSWSETFKISSLKYLK